MQFFQFDKKVSAVPWMGSKMFPEVSKAAGKLAFTALSTDFAMAVRAAVAAASPSGTTKPLMVTRKLLLT